MGVFAVLVLVVAKRDMDLKRFIKSVKDSVKIGCMVLVLIAGATVLGHFFAVTKMPFLVADWLANATGSPEHHYHDYSSSST